MYTMRDEELHDWLEVTNYDRETWMLSIKFGGMPLIVKEVVEVKRDRKCAYSNGEI